MKEAQIEPVNPESREVEGHDRWAKKERGYKGLLARANKEISRLKGEQVEGEVDGPAVSSKHDFSPAFPTCLTCGTENPNYESKPVRCSNDDCHAPLGTERILPKIDRCPKCGSTEAEVYNEQEKE